jgi:hypothetical protein
VIFLFPYFYFKNPASVPDFEGSKENFFLRSKICKTGPKTLHAGFVKPKTNLIFYKYSTKKTMNRNIKWSPGARGASESDQSGGGAEEISQ